MSIKNQKRTIVILLIVQILVLVGVFSYAWFANDFDPVIYSDQLSIASSEGLYIQLENVGEHSKNPTEVYDVINLKDIEDRNVTFSTLSQVSSSDGMNFYSRIEEDGIISYEQDTKKENYIEIAIMLVNSGDSAREVYIESLSLKLLKQVTTDGTTTDVEQTTDTSMVRDALRMGIEIDEINGTLRHNYIIGFNKDYDNVTDATSTGEVLDRYDGFKDTSNNAYTTELTPITTGTYATKGYTTNNAICRSGVSDETDSTVKAVNTDLTYINCRDAQTVYYLNCFKKYIGTEANTNYIDGGLTTIAAKSNLKFTFRLWLEGADPRCDIPITGTTLQMNLVIGNVEITS